LLLDPPPLDWILGKGFPDLSTMAQQQTNSFKETANRLKNSNNNEAKRQVSFFTTLASEHEEMFLSSVAQVSKINSFNNIPLIVIASGKSNPVFGNNAETFQNFLNQQCEELANKSTNGKYILARESSHHIHRDNPDLVLKVIDNLIAKTRK
jgi:hypothetical protein